MHNRFKGNLSWASTQSLPCQLGPPLPRLPPNCISHAVLTSPLERSTCPNQWNLLSQNEVKALMLELCQELAWPYCGHIPRLDTADLSDHGPVIALQALQGLILVNGQVHWHGAPHSRAVHMATGLVREFVGCDNMDWVNIFLKCFPKLLRH